MKSYFLEKLKDNLASQHIAKKLAIKSGDQSYTYSEIYKVIGRVVNTFQSKENGLIGIITGTDTNVYACILGIVASGNAYVPINTKHPIDRLINIIKRSGVKRIIYTGPVTQEIQALKESLDIQIFSMNDLSQETICSIDTQSDNNRLAYILYTSGSTGEPKGVPIYLRNLDAYMLTLISGPYGFDQDDQIMQMFELTFDFSVFPIFLNFSLGATIHILQDGGIKPLKVFEMLEDDKITVAAMVPSVISYLKPYFEEISLPDLKINVFCGEALYQNVLEGWAKVGPNSKQYNFYGPTEATVFCLDYLWDPVTSADEAVNGIVAIGVPMRGTEVCVIDDQNLLLEDTQKGELCLMGEQVTDQYWNDPEKTATSFIDVDFGSESKLVYKTGDVVFKNENGNFIYCGRTDNQVKVDGYRIELSEIEHHIKEATKAVNVACITIPNEKGNLSIHAFVEAEQVDSATVKAHLEGQLPYYMIPKSMTAIPLMPLNLNGKIDRKALKKIKEES